MSNRTFGFANPPHGCHPPASHQPSKDQSQPPPRDMPPLPWCATPHGKCHPPTDMPWQLLLEGLLFFGLCKKKKKKEKKKERSASFPRGTSRLFKADVFAPHRTPAWVNSWRDKRLLRAYREAETRANQVIGKFYELNGFINLALANPNVIANTIPKQGTTPWVDFVI